MLKVGKTKRNKESQNLDMCSKSSIFAKNIIKERAMYLEFTYDYYKISMLLFAMSLTTTVQVPITNQVISKLALI